VAAVADLGGAELADKSLEVLGTCSMEHMIVHKEGEARP
jgi:hypothetical protein